MPELAAATAVDTATLNQDGGQLVSKTGYTTLFWLRWLLVAAIGGGVVTLIVTRRRRQHRETMLRLRMAGLVSDRDQRADADRERELIRS